MTYQGKCFCVIYLLYIYMNNVREVGQRLDIRDSTLEIRKSKLEIRDSTLEIRISKLEIRDSNL
jgi:hypothetical protein